MIYILLFFFVGLVGCLPSWGQPGVVPNRKSEIEYLSEKVYSLREFKRMADSMQLSVPELSDYPVIFPVLRPYISSEFGKRRHPVSKLLRNHTGVDFAEVKGTPVYATGNGVVSRRGYGSGYGYYIEIKHAGGFRSFYAHLSKALVSAGDTVKMGKHIAYVGNSGVATGCHLHYEIRKGKRFLDPMEWCCYLLEVLKINSS